MFFDLTGRGHRHDHGHRDDQHNHHAGRYLDESGKSRLRRGRLEGIAAIMVPFGAAASPDLTILPVFLAAAAVGAATAIGSLAIFAAVTIATIVGLTLAATRGGYQIRGQWLERWGHVFTALVLVVIGALVFTGLI
jgi:hypothetical protein